MATFINGKEHLKKEIDALPPALLQEVIDFVEFLLLKKGGIDYVYLLAQQKNLEKIWVSDAEDLYAL